MKKRLEKSKEIAIKIKENFKEKCDSNRCSECEYHNHNNIDCRTLFVVDFIEKIMPLDKDKIGTNWANVKIDTPVMARIWEDHDLVPRHFARYEDGKVYVWTSGRTSHSTDNMTESIETKLL